MRCNQSKNKKSKVVCGIMIVMLLSGFAGFLYVDRYLGRIKTVEISEKDEDLGIKPDKKENEKEDKENEVINIALFGGDRRKKNDVVHSDAIMIASIDKIHNTIKLSSIMRDTYVNVDGHGMTKINHAYAYGGPELAIKTLNQNFDLNIRDYVFVDFYGFEKVVDALGGIDMDLKEQEVPEMNRCIREVAGIKNTQPNLIKRSGMNHLNGEQAVAYSRIRKVGAGDFERTDRQRKVMYEMFKSVKSAGITKYPKIVESVIPYVETSLSKAEIIKLGTSSLACDIENIQQNRFPMDEYCKDQRIDGIYYLVTDLEETQKQMHEFIYGTFEQCKSY
jgi:LCP family protein required for cell wall assembly